MCNSKEDNGNELYDYVVMSETSTSSTRPPEIKPVLVRSSYTDAENYVRALTPTMAMVNTKLYIERVPRKIDE